MHGRKRVLVYCPGNEGKSRDRELERETRRAWATEDIHPLLYSLAAHSLARSLAAWLAGWLAYLNTFQSSSTCTPGMAPDQYWLILLRTAGSEVSALVHL